MAEKPGMIDEGVDLKKMSIDELAAEAAKNAPREDMTALELGRMLLSAECGAPSSSSYFWEAAICDRPLCPRAKGAHFTGNKFYDAGVKTMPAEPQRERDSAG